MHTHTYVHNSKKSMRHQALLILIILGLIFRIDITTEAQELRLLPCMVHGEVYASAWIATTHVLVNNSRLNTANITLGI